MSCCDLVQNSSFLSFLSYLSFELSKHLHLHFRVKKPYDGPIISNADDPNSRLHNLVLVYKQLRAFYAVSSVFYNFSFHFFGFLSVNAHRALSFVGFALLLLGLAFALLTRNVAI